MKRALLPFVMAFLSLGLSPAADAQGFLEVVTGAAVPIGDDRYADVVDTRYKLGLRAGGFGGSVFESARLAVELGADWTPSDTELDSSLINVDIHRFRFLAGIRLLGAVGKNALLFARLAGGLDWIRAEGTASLLGFRATYEEDDYGLALEPGVGALFRIGGLGLGFQLAAPFAFHDDDDEGDGVDYEYKAYDFDMLVTLGAGW
ncbi:MAG: hypothetical protein HY698_16705 [Deltaproteobacteria bacterium]|nr:hypothetical protein [Deltaproteobacteria bacterium]